jgi:hypothetical protein
MLAARRSAMSFGWVLSGSNGSLADRVVNTSNLFVSTDMMNDFLLDHFWYSYPYFLAID